MTDFFYTLAAAEQGMGWTKGKQFEIGVRPNLTRFIRLLPSGAEWHPITSEADCWALLDQVQRRHRPWRFSLTGGDSQMTPRWLAEIFAEDNSVTYASVHNAVRTRAITIAICRALGLE